MLLSFERVLLFVLLLSGSIAVASTAKWFDKFMIVLLENQDLSSVLGDSSFNAITSTGLLHTNYHAVAHPSQPNYWALIAGAYNFPGQTFVGGQKTPTTVTSSNGDSNFDIYNTDTVVDLLEDAGLDYKIYSENYPTPGSCYLGSSYGNESATDVAYFQHFSVSPLSPAYVRKHNPFISFKTFTSNKRRCAAQRDFIDMNRDISNGRLPAFSFIVPNLAHDGHDTTISYSSSWLSQFIRHLTASPDYRQSRVAVHVVYDEDDNSGANNGNKVYSLLLSNALPSELVGVTDGTYYTHYSTLTTLEANWNLRHLGKDDVGASVFKLSGNSNRDSTQLAVACNDNATASFRVGQIRRNETCHWLRFQKRYWISRYCTRVAALCPHTCKAC